MYVKSFFIAVSCSYRNSNRDNIYFHVFSNSTVYTLKNESCLLQIRADLGENPTEQNRPLHGFRRHLGCGAVAGKFFKYRPS